MIWNCSDMDGSFSLINIIFDCDTLRNYCGIAVKNVIDSINWILHMNLATCAEFWASDCDKRARLYGTGSHYKYTATREGIPIHNDWGRLTILFLTTLHGEAGMIALAGQVSTYCWFPGLGLMPVEARCQVVI